MTRIRLLLIEDNDTDALLVVRQLKKEGFDVDHMQVKTREEMEQALENHSWDLVISDYSLPGFGGKDALMLFKAKNLDIPFILVSGTVGEDIAVTIMKGGANDYLMKTHLHRLGPAVKRELEETQVHREKIRIESMLTQTERRFQRLIEDLRDCVFLLSMDSQQLMIINQAFETIYGRTLLELKEHPLLWIEAIHTDDKSVVTTMADDLKANGIWEGEYRILRPDGTLRWVYDRRCRVFSESESEPLMGGVITDITEKKQFEEDLVHAKQEAEESSRLKSALLQNMSHEFRTPMNGILGFSEMLYEELDTDENRAKAEFILMSGKRLQQTLDSIMLFSQLASGITLKPNELDVTELVNAAIQRIQEPAKMKGLIIHAEVPDKMPVYTDSQILRRAVDEILDNAVKFTQQGSISITVSCSDAGREQVSIRVRDTGIGIPPEKHAIIFEEFRQAEEGYNRPYEGSGLGLSIASKSMKILGGTLSCDSHPDKGSVFTLTLPVNSPADIGEEKKPEKKGFLHPPVPNPPEEKTPSVLLVEDNDANIALVLAYLSGKVYIDVATNGESAIGMATKNQYDCILMDINLGPGINGIEAIAEIRKMQEHRKTPIIAVTGYTFRNEKEFIISQGADHYLEKPFTRTHLLQLLDQVISIT